MSWRVLVSYVDSKSGYETTSFLSLSVGDTHCLARFCPETMHAVEELEKPRVSSLQHNLQGITKHSKDKKTVAQLSNTLEQMDYTA